MIRDTLFNISLLQSINKSHTLKIPDLPSSLQLKKTIQTLNCYDKNEEICKRIDILKNNLLIQQDNQSIVDLSFKSILHCNKLENEYNKLDIQLKQYYKTINTKNFYIVLPSILMTQHKLLRCKRKLLPYWSLLSNNTQKSLMNDYQFTKLFKDDVNFCLELFQIFKLTLDPNLLSEIYQETNKVLIKIGSYFLSFTEIDSQIEQTYETKLKCLPKLPNYLTQFIIYSGQLKQA